MRHSPSTCRSSRGTPLLKLDQIAYDAPGRAVLLSVEWHVADAFELIVNRRASAD